LPSLKPVSEGNEASDSSSVAAIRLQPRGMALLSETAAVITYECTARRKDGERYRALVSSGYSKLPEGWKLAFHQQTGLKA